MWDPQYKNKYAIGGVDQYMHNVAVAVLAHGISPENLYNYDVLNTPDLRNIMEYLVVNAHSMWVGVDDAKTLKGLFSSPVITTVKEKLTKEEIEQFRLNDPKLWKALIPRDRIGLKKLWTDAMMKRLKNNILHLI